MPAPAPPEAVDAAFLLRAKGYSLAASGRAVGYSAEGVRGWLLRMGERYERIKTLAQYRWGKNVLRSADAVSRALIGDATSTERDSKGRPVIRGSDRAQCARALWEPFRGPESLTINGDVDASQVNIDARSITLLDAKEIMARGQAIRDELGIG